ncbi:sensor domain-containing diguanylate cyclase [Desulfovibrio sp. JY]|nr:sensor domain-containing diguanylate cyclase [Desulfovibrio sp. JY]
MSLRYKLLMLMVTPIVVLCGVHMLELERVTSGFEQALLAHRNQATRAVAHNLENAINALGRITVNLSHPKEIVRAVLTADNEVLFDWSHSFTKNVGVILFADVRGLVLSRAPDEFHFGDAVADSVWFKRALHEGSFYGIATVDGVPSLVGARTVRKYDDMPVGVVCVAVPITPAWLASFTDDRQVLRVQTPAGIIASVPTPPDTQPPQPLDLANIGFAAPTAFSVAFLPDPQYRELVGLKKSLLASGGVTALVTILALILILSRQLRPYTAVVENLLAYSRNALSLERLRERLKRLSPRRENELYRIVDALMHMIVTIEHNFDRMEGYADELEILANTDALTGLNNRKAINETLDAAMAHFEKDDTPFAVLMLDIDRFKAVNDTHGHQAGDTVLRTVADILRANCRQRDAVSRWGGEEFLIVSQGGDANDARALAERLRAAVAAGRFPAAEQVTVSIGVVCARKDDTLDSLISRADAALYAAKHAGRNTIRQS